MTRAERATETAPAEEPEKSAEPQEDLIPLPGDEEDQGDEEDEEDQGDSREWPEVRAWNATKRGAKWAAKRTAWRRPSAQDGGWLLVGMVGYALGMSLLRYGPTGPRSWLQAKFLNRPVQGLDPTNLPSPPTPGRGGIPT